MEGEQIATSTEGAATEQTQVDTGTESTENTETSETPSETSEETSQETAEETSTEQAKESYSKQEFDEYIAREKTKYEEQAKHHQSAFTKASQEAAELRKRLADYENKQREQEINARFEDIDRLAETYSDVAPLAKTMKEQYAEISALKKQLSEFAPLLGTIKQGADQQWFQEVKAAVPDALAHWESPEFQKWNEMQAVPLNDKMPREQFIRGMKAFEFFLDASGQKAAKSAVEAKAQKAKEGLKAASNTPGKPQAVGNFTREQIAKMNLADYKKNETAILKAYKEGRIT